MAWIILVWTIVVSVACSIATRSIVLEGVETQRGKEREASRLWSHFIWYAVNDRLKGLGLKAVFGPDFRIVVPGVDVQVNANGKEFEVYILGLDQRGEPEWICEECFSFGHAGGREAADLVRDLVLTRRNGLLPGVGTVAQ